MASRSRIARSARLGALSVLLVLSAVAHAEGQMLTTEVIDNFFTTLEGKWEGRAVTTPVGPRPYDITFQRTATGALAGAANPGASTHYWTFSRDGQRLKLRFLSTFAGNREPLLLTATTAVGDAVIFRTADEDFLEVRVKPAHVQTSVRILLRGKPHVEIRLSRALPERETVE